MEAIGPPGKGARGSLHLLSLELSQDMEGLGHAFLLGADATVTALTVNTSRRGGQSQAPRACLRASGWWEAHGRPSSVPPPHWVLPLSSCQQKGATCHSS